jgi:hypothetical protein
MDECQILTNEQIKWVFREDTHNQLNGNKVFGILSRAKQCNLVIIGKGH